jgi:ABC-type branched-subunit amino acid transport system substrate-binding protein
MSYFKGLLISGLLIVGAVAGCVPAGPAPAGAPEPRVGTVPEREAAEAEAPLETAAPVVLGVIVPQSGDPFLEQFGGQVLDGIRLAVEAHNRVSGAPVEMVILDDEGEPARAAALVAELEARGAVAIVGPLRPEGIAAAAAARRDSQLLLLSPTSPDLPSGEHLYSLNTVDARGAEIMASYALSSGLRRVGLLYSEAPEYRRQAQVFREALVRGGGTIVSEAAYPPGTTTFATPLQALAGAKPDAVFIPASERDVRQLAPQITYYGLAATGAQILGGEGWSGDNVLHEVAARYLEGVVATTALYRPSPEFGWTEFVALYEDTYRRSLENALPALGFDAAKLVLRTLGSGRMTPEAIARRFEESDELRGATGWISIRAGQVERRPILVRIEKGTLVPLPAAGSPSSEH